MKYKLVGWRNKKTKEFSPVEETVFWGDDHADWVEEFSAAPTPEQPEPNINTCPGCGGDADNGHDRCCPPNPYYCTKCQDRLVSAQQPVAWLSRNHAGHEIAIADSELRTRQPEHVQELWKDATPLYTAAPPAGDAEVKPECTKFVESDFDAAVRLSKELKQRDAELLAAKAEIERLRSCKFSERNYTAMQSELADRDKELLVLREALQWYDLDYEDEPINYVEALQLAYMKRDGSNLARAYVAIAENNKKLIESTTASAKAIEDRIKRETILECIERAKKELCNDRHSEYTSAQDEGVRAVIKSLEEMLG